MVRSTVQTFSGGTLLPAKGIFEGVIAGSADIGNFAMSYHPGRFSLSEAIDLPHEFTNAKIASFVLYDLIEKYKPKEFEKVKVLTAFTCQPTNIMTKTPLTSFKDLKGLELIVNLPVVSFAVVMNKDKWNALPSDVKKVFDDLSKEQALWTASYVDNHVKDALKWSKKEQGLKIINLSKMEKVEISRQLKPMIDDYIKKVNSLRLNGDKIIKDINELKAKYEKQYKSEFPQ